MLANPLTYLANPVVPITIDRDATISVRRDYGKEGLVAAFAAPITLYRVLDGEELVHVQQMGIIEGGMFATPGERAHGASWSATLEGLVRWGKGWQQRIGKDLFIAEIQGQGRRFYHIQPRVRFDPQGPEHQPAEMDSAKCSTGLGCSVRVPAAEARFFKVLPSGDLRQLTSEHIQAYARKKPLKDVVLRSPGNPTYFVGTILGVSVGVYQDDYGKLWTVETRSGFPFIMGAKTKKQAIEAARDTLLGGGTEPRHTFYLNLRTPGFDRVLPGQTWGQHGDIYEVTEVGANFVNGKWLKRWGWEGSYQHIDSKRFMKEFRFIDGPTVSTPQGQSWWKLRGAV